MKIGGYKMITGIINLLGLACCGIVLSHWAYETFNLGALKSEDKVESVEENREVENNIQPHSEFELFL